MITEAHEWQSQVGKQHQRYRMFGEIAAGGMARVHLARLTGPGGFSRVVAMKHLHPHLSADPEFRAMFIDEAWLAARIRHANVVPTLDVLVEDGETFLIMDYVHGEPLSVLRRATEKLGIKPSLPICSAIMVGALQGLHAAHEARSESGEMLHIVHRDVSPQNIMVSADGVPIVLDFGVAKALQAHEETKPGVIKGKSGYMAPEQIRGEEVTRAADIFAASVVLWELLTGRRLFGGGSELERLNRVLLGTGVVPPSQIVSGIPPEIDAVVMKGLSPDPSRRYGTALEMVDALESAIAPASQRTLAVWVRFISAESLGHRAELLNELELSGVTTRVTSAIEVGPPAIVDVARVPEPTPFRAPAGWRDRRAIIAAGVAAGAGLAALVLLLLAPDSAGRKSQRNATVPPSAERLVAPAVTALAAPSEPSSPPPAIEPPPEVQPATEMRTKATGSISQEAEPDPAGRGAVEAERDQAGRGAVAIPRRTWRKRSGIPRSARFMWVARASGVGGAPSWREPSAHAPGVGAADPPSAVSPADGPGRSGAAAVENKARVPLLDDPPHVPLLE